MRKSQRQNVYLPEEEVRGHKIKIIYTTKDKVPKTNLMNFVLLTFNPQFGMNVDQLFKQKYDGVSFEDFEHVYAIATIYPGMYAPPMDDAGFWNRHAMLKVINQ